jgi:hypothetical protein
MDDADAEKPVEAMSYLELDREISERTRRYELTADSQTGRISVFALPLDRQRPTIARSGTDTDAVLRELLRVLRSYGWPPGLMRPRHSSDP